MFLLFTKTILDLSPTQPRISSVLEAASTFRGTDHSPPSSDEAKDAGATPPLSPIFHEPVLN
jgi:hypothetical protein